VRLFWVISRKRAVGSFVMQGWEEPHRERRDGSKFSTGKKEENRRNRCIIVIGRKIVRIKKLN
jgi:hypothetical protein